MCVWQWCIHQVPCVWWWHKSVGGGGGGRDGVVVGGVGGTHSPHPHHHAPPWRPPPVPLCVCVSGGHKGRGGGDHTPNHPCMRHACASRVCVRVWWRMRAGGWAHAHPVACVCVGRVGSEATSVCVEKTEVFACHRLRHHGRSSHTLCETTENQCGGECDVREGRVK